jgi:hypothetical protein
MESPGKIETIEIQSKGGLIVERAETPDGPLEAHGYVGVNRFCFRDGRANELSGAGSQLCEVLRTDSDLDKGHLAVGKEFGTA